MQLDLRVQFKVGANFTSPFFFLQVVFLPTAFPRLSLRHSPLLSCITFHGSCVASAFISLYRIALGHLHAAPLTTGGSSYM